jgi:hypothetical protein
MSRGAGKLAVATLSVGLGVPSSACPRPPWAAASDEASVRPASPAQEGRVDAPLRQLSVPGFTSRRLRKTADFQRGSEDPHWQATGTFHRCSQAESTTNNAITYLSSMLRLVLRFCVYVSSQKGMR